MNKVIWNAFAHELEKQARVGFLARPSSGKMARAALLGLGLGGAGLAAATPATVRNMEQADALMGPEPDWYGRSVGRIRTQIQRTIPDGPQNLSRQFDLLDKLRPAREAGLAIDQLLTGRQ